MLETLAFKSNLKSYQKKKLQVFNLLVYQLANLFSQTVLLLFAFITR